MAGGKPTSRRNYAIAACVLLFLLGSAWLGYRWAKRDGLATLVSIEGEPERDTARAIGRWTPAHTGDEFFGGDGARTAAAETATFRLFNGARLALRPSSKVRFQTRADKNALGVAVEVGQADIETSSGALLIDSEFGPIRILANSKMALRRTGKQLGVDVELGAVMLGSEGRRVVAGDSVDVELGGVVLEAAAPSASAAPKEAEPAPDTQQQLEVGDGVAFADLVVMAGDTFTVHDPKSPTRVGITLDKVCGGKPGQLTAGKQRTQAEHVARLSFGPGRHEYQVRCLDDLSRVVSSGVIAIVLDAGTRNLPTFAPSANVSTDGRQYTVLYQHRLPQVHVSWPNAPSATNYTLQLDDRTITTSSPTYTIGSLPRGTHRLTFSAASSPPRKSRTTTVSVVYDAQAPAARVAMPPGGYDPSGPVEVAGQALPGWTVSVAGKELEVDGQRRFSTRVAAQAALPIAFSHPSHGTHYYLRRSKSSAP